MAVNPLGAVQIFDGGTPRLITALASNPVTGGQLVWLSGAVNNISSGANSYVSSDISIGGPASGVRFNGIVITPGNTASGTSTYVTVGLAGCYIVSAGSEVYSGQAVEAIGADSVMRLGSHAVPGASDDPKGAGRKIGRAISEATSGTTNFALIQLTP